MLCLLHLSFLLRMPLMYWSLRHLSILCRFDLCFSTGCSTDDRSTGACACCSWTNCCRSCSDYCSGCSRDCAVCWSDCSRCWSDCSRGCIECFSCPEVKCCNCNCQIQPPKCDKISCCCFEIVIKGQPTAAQPAGGASPPALASVSHA